MLITSCYWINFYDCINILIVYFRNRHTIFYKTVEICISYAN